jgi:serine/threonine protein phosphatase PrpC
VCDGTASWGEGQEAARTAARAIADTLVLGGSINAAVESASRRARSLHHPEGEDAPAFSVVVAVVEPPVARLAWVGDVHALHIRDGQVIARNVAHSLAAELVRAGKASWQDAVGAKAGAVTVPLPGTAVWEETARIDQLTWTLSPGDRLLLGSAQLPRAMSPVEAAAEVTVASSPDEAVVRLLARPRERSIELALAVVLVD